jgi:hypothetical protein
MEKVHLTPFIQLSSRVADGVRRADEFYVETKKDSAAAQALQEEIESAKLGHPAARQDVAFTSRASAITKRLLSRGNPISSTSTLPRPTHSLFTEQAAANKEIAQSLSSELNAAMDVGRQAEKSAREYHGRFEAVLRVDMLCSTAKKLSTQYDSIIERFMTGLIEGDGDGSPPNLTTPACLEATRQPRLEQPPPPAKSSWQAPTSYAYRGGG